MAQVQQGKSKGTSGMVNTEKKKMPLANDSQQTRIKYGGGALNRILKDRVLWQEIRRHRKTLGRQEARRRRSRTNTGGLCGGSVVKRLPANAGDTGTAPGQGRPHMSPSDWALHRSYWACALEPQRHNYWACTQLLKPTCPRARAPQQEKPLQLENSTHLPQVEKNLCSNEDPAQPKRNK